MAKYPCPPPQPLLSARATATVTAVPEAWNLNYRQAENATAQAALNTPAPKRHVSDADSQNYSNSVTLAAKKRDCVVLDSSFELAFEVLGGCPPYGVTLETSGLIVSTHRCLPRKGAVLLSISQIFEGDAFSARSKKTLKATLRVRDCSGHNESCTVEILEA